jgi:hypothetical protein
MDSVHSSRRQPLLLGAASLGGMLLIGLLTAAGPAPANTTPAANLVIARDYPNAAIFMEMAVRGGRDYFIVNRCAPPDLAAVIDAGDTAYLFPDKADFEFRVEEGLRVRAISHNQPVYERGRTDAMRTRGRGFPKPGLGSQIDLPANDIAPATSFRSYNFESAKYLEQGATLAELDVIQRRMRLAAHLTRATEEYIIASKGLLPRDLAAVEQFIGVPRNPAGWEEIAVVERRQMVENAAGNLYYGKVSDGTWEISINLGPEVRTYKFAIHGGAWQLASGFIY